MAWGSFSGFVMGPLIKIDDILDRFVYAEEYMSVKWIFQHYNDPKHTSKLVKDLGYA